MKNKQLFASPSTCDAVQCLKQSLTILGRLNEGCTYHRPQHKGREDVGGVEEHGDRRADC